MSLRGLSVLVLLCLAGCTSTPVQEPPVQSPPAATPPAEAPPTGTPPTGNPPPSTPPVVTCTPRTCALLGAQCGVADDGCGGSLLCGGCAPGQLCAQGRCEACTPRTCEDALAHCGELSDGCGGTLRCDACPSGQTCGEDRLATVCVAPGSAPATAWVKTFPHRVTALATDSRAHIALISQPPDGAAPSMLDSHGQLLWARPGVSPHVSLRGLSVAPSGELLAWGWNHGESGPGGAIAYGFDALGNQPTVIGLCGDECGIGPFFKDSAGHLLSYSLSSAGIGVHHGQGATRWSLVHSYSPGPLPPDYPQTPFEYSPPVFDSQGNVLVAGELEGKATFQGRSFGADSQATVVVMKLSPQGQLLWARELPSDRVGTYRYLLQATASGMVVGVGSFTGTLTWPGGMLRAAGPTLIALDAQGHLAWAQPLPLGASAFSISPSGRIAVASTFSEPYTYARGAFHVREYEPQGHLRWSRTWSPLDASGSLSLAGMAWSGEALVLAGSFHGAADFGTGVQQGPTEPYTAEGFVLELQQP
ncbi:hypothetical protein NR798_47520 [Archangium gephyra]|uniref:hypothetical protein n=1 Tax=Archangium gephyra TaxID=48 RepID=UPI0035D3E5F2